MLFFRLIIFLGFFSVFSQNSIFDIARSGTLEEFKEFQSSILFDVNQTNREGYTLLVIAAYNSNMPILNYLISEGANVDMGSDYGTALMGAVFKNNIEILSTLLDAGADVNLTDNKKRTAMHLAVIFSNTRAIEELMKYKPNLFIKDNNDFTVLDYVKIKNDTTLLNLLKPKL
jgi:uncharacterized protein